MTEIDGMELPEAVRDEWLRRLRKERGVSQKSLGKSVGVDNSYISMIEGGDRALSMKSAERVADALDTDPLALYVSSYTDAVIKAVEEETSIDNIELSKLVRLRSKLAKLSVDDELPESKELDSAIEHLLDTIEMLEGGEPDLRADARSLRRGQDRSSCSLQADREGGDMGLKNKPHRSGAATEHGIPQVHCRPKFSSSVII